MNDLSRVPEDVDNKDNECCEGRILGCLPRVSKVGDWPTSEAIAPLLHTDKWEQFGGINIDKHKWMVKDQGNQGSCAGAAAVGAFMLVRAVAGLPQVHLSQAVPYALSNGGRDNGASIDTILQKMMEVGTVPDSYIDSMDWRGYGRKQWPEDWRDEAKDYQIFEAWDCPTYKHVISALCHGFPCVGGVTWSGGGGHAIIFTGWKGGQTRILNSWGADYGDDGIGWLPDRQVERGIVRYGAWALRVVTRPNS